VAPHWCACVEWPKHPNSRRVHTLIVCMRSTAVTLRMHCFICCALKCSDSPSRSTTTCAMHANPRTGEPRRQNHTTDGRNP